MRYKKIFAWILCVATFFTLLLPLFEAKEITDQKITQELAQASQRLARINQMVAKTARLSIPPARAIDDTDQFKNLAMGLQAPETAIVGDVIPIVVAAINANEIAKVNLIISDPKTNQEYFKDSYENVKKDDRFMFTYDWDTYAAQTNVDSADSTHKVRAEAYRAEADSTFSLLGISEMNVKILSDPGIDLNAHGFWRGYLMDKNNAQGLSQEWKTKLNCSSNACNSKEEIRSALSAAISNGDATAEDIAELTQSFNRYVHQLELNYPSGDGAVSATAYSFNMMDLVTYANEMMDQKDGLATYQLDQETLMAPETITIMNVINEYSVKLASRDPQSLDELKAMDIWPEMEQKIKDRVAKDEEDQITDISQLNLPTAYNSNPLGVKKAKAWATAVIGVGVTAWDVYQFARHPSWKSAGMVGLDIAFIPFGGASLGEKLFVKGAQIFGKIPQVARGIQAVKNIRLVGRASEAATKVWGAIKGSAAMAQKLAPLASKAWGFVRGRFKKAWSALVAGARWAAYAIIRNQYSGDTCKCTEDAIRKALGGNLFQTFMWPMCNVACVIVNGLLEIAKWIIDKFPQAMEAYIPVKKWVAMSIPIIKAQAPCTRYQ